MTICQVPTLGAYSADCGNLFSLWRTFNRAGLDVIFNFSTCNFLRPEAVAFLGGLAQLVEHRGGRVAFEWDSLTPAVRANLAQNGFIKAFSGPATPWVGNSVPYLAHRECAPGAFSAYVQQLWLRRGWLGMSDQLVGHVTSNVSEAYVNVFEHAQSAVGVHCCGQYFPKLKILSLTMVDFGIGIPQNVRRFIGSKTGMSNVSASKCIEWAFQRGTSTRSGESSGGLGLDNLCNFVKVNNGSLEFYSHDGRASLRNRSVAFSDCADYFEGTMVTVRLRCDDRYYVLGSELASLNPFQSPPSLAP